MGNELRPHIGVCCASQTLSSVSPGTREPPGPEVISIRSEPSTFDTRRPSNQVNGVPTTFHPHPVAREPSSSLQSNGDDLDASPPRLSRPQNGSWLDSPLSSPLPLSLLSTQEALACDSELLYEQLLASYTYVRLSEASRPPVPKPSGSVGVYLFQKRAADVALSVRELVLRSQPQGAEHEMVEHRFWMPLTEVKTNIMGEQVEISWSDCDNLELSGTFEGTAYYRRVYNPSTRNNSIQLAFLSEVDASDFTRRIHTPGKSSSHSLALDFSRRAFGLAGDMEETVQLLSLPESSSARLILHSSQDSPSTRVSKLYSVSPQTDFSLNPGAGGDSNSACIRFLEAGKPHHRSNARSLVFSQAETTRGYPADSVFTVINELEFIMNDSQGKS